MTPRIVTVLTLIRPRFRSISFGVDPWFRDCREKNYANQPWNYRDRILHRFWDITRYWQKIVVFTYPHGSTLVCPKFNEVTLQIFGRCLEPKWGKDYPINSWNYFPTLSQYMWSQYTNVPDRRSKLNGTFYFFNQQ